MEIKTCEHFVVNRLMELENEVDMQKDYICKQEDIIKDLRERLEFVGKFLSIRRAYDWDSENKNTYIDFSSVWKKHNPDNYKKLCEMFDLVEPDELEEEE